MASVVDHLFLVLYKGNSTNQDFTLKKSSIISVFYFFFLRRYLVQTLHRNKKRADCYPYFIAFSNTTLICKYKKTVRVILL